MSSRRLLLVLSLALLLCGSVPLAAQTRKPAPAPPRSVASDGTVTGALIINGKSFPLTHVYGRKREAWPADAKALSVADGDELSCGIVELLFVSEALSAETIAAILQNEYPGSDKIRGIRFVIDGSGKYKWDTTFLLESGVVKGYGMTQSSGSIEGGRRFSGKVSFKNQDVTQVRQFDMTFDTDVTVQYTRTETEGAERVPESRFTEEFLEVLPGEWTIERWVGLSCTSATGTLTVGARTSPRTFQGVFHITTSKGDEVEEDVVISIAGGKVHLEGGKLNVPPSIWGRDVIDLELWPDLLIGNNATDFLVMRKSQ